MSQSRQTAFVLTPEQIKQLASDLKIKDIERIPNSIVVDASHSTQHLVSNAKAVRGGSVIIDIVA